jgi:cyclic pyranopterin phosphate synthase
VAATGLVRGCLFANEAVDLKPYLKSIENWRLREIMRRIVTEKPGRHHLAEDDSDHGAVAMSRIGG